MQRIPNYQVASNMQLNLWLRYSNKQGIQISDNQVSKMSNKADPTLLALLQKVSKPITSLPVTFKLKGVFAPPEQWKITDEANPGLFSYSLEGMQIHFTGGKIEPRKLTEKELRDLEQAKNKKGSKKQSKQQQKPVEPDPEAERKRLQWQALSQQQKFYRTQQDPYKAFSLLWAEHEKSSILQGNSLQHFENYVSNGHFQLTLTRKPEGSEDDIAKLKKGKPKNLNLGELYAAKYKGKVDLSGFQIPGSKKITTRVPIRFGGEIPPQCIKIQSDKCYALVEIELKEALNPQVTKVTPDPKDLLAAQPQSLKGALLGRLREQIRKGVRAISQQYTAFFAKQKQHSDQKKFGSTSNNTNLLNVSTLRINEINKRKELFLQEFISSGKYALLRDKIVRTVRAIIVDKCRKEKEGASVTREALQKVLAQLNVYFKDMLQKSLDQCINQDAALIHQDLILNHEYARSSRKQTLAGMAQAEEERQARLASQYQTINRVEQAEQKYLNLVLLNNNSTASLQAYAKFSLRHSKYDQAFALYSRVNNSSKQFKHRLILSLFRIHRGRDRQAAQLLQGLEKAEGTAVDEKIIIHQLLSLVEERLGQQKASEKHTALAQKYYQMKNNPSIRINPPKNPYLDPTPKVPKPGRYISQLSQQQSQEIRLSLMQYFIEYNFYGLARGYLNKISEGQKKQHIGSLVLMGEQKYQQALQKVEKLLQKNSRNIDYLMLKADICFRSDKMFECEEVFLYLLNLKPTSQHAYSIYLRLAFTYLNRKSWEDAKSAFNKAVQIKSNSAVGWLGLGIATLQLGELRQSEEAFNLSSIYNPLSKEPSEYLQRISEAIGEEHKRSYKYFQQGQ